MGYSILYCDRNEAPDARETMVELKKCLEAQGIPYVGTPVTITFPGNGVTPTYTEPHGDQYPLYRWNVEEVVEDGGPSWVPGECMIYYPAINNTRSVKVLVDMQENGGSIIIH